MFITLLLIDLICLNRFNTEVVKAAVRAHDRVKETNKNAGNVTVREKLFNLEFIF